MSVRKKSAPAPSAEPKVRATRKKAAESPKSRSRETASAEKGPAASPKGTLIIVESPTKARTLTRILGSGYKVKASVGHLKDLPPSRIGVDLDNDYELQFVVSEGKKKVLDEIRQAARGAREIFLASDPDREGEAIAYHIASELTGLKKPIRRVLVHELTPRGIEAALAEPGEIDLHKVDAQKARRALDRIVGYTISPLLWERVRRGLSAGRVQSVAVRLVCDRENEIRSFVPVEYWTITLEMRPSDPARSGSIFTARLDRISGKKVQIGTAAEAQETVDRILSEGFRIASLSADEKRRQPSPPLTTSRLQQEGARRFRFSAKKTMQLAQKLYEGVELPGQGQTGLITYMRTDSVRLAPEAQEMARSFIAKNYPGALPPKSPAYRNKKGIQDAHEAIRPTDVVRTPDSLEGILDRDLLRVYRLIWQSFLESQMLPARYLLTTVTIEGDREDTFRATGRRMLDPGFLVLRGDDGRSRKKVEGGEEEGEEKAEEENELPLLHEGEPVEAVAPPVSLQHFTEPPSRYNEASLIKELEEKGIGRPSTYATIMTTILDREYVEKRENRFHPTELGETVNRLLVDSFPDLLNVAFTARMEEELDSVEEGEKVYRDAVDDFYRPFSKELSKARGGGMANLKAQSEPTEIPCPLCGTLMVKKWGRHGAYLACGNYPACKTTRNIVETENGPAPEVLPEAAGETCPVCGKPMVVRKGRFGTFLACSGYPTCKTTRPWPPKGQAATPAVPLPAEIPPCPACGGAMVIKTGRFGSFLSCANYPKCKTTRPLPTGIACTRPGCGGEITPRKGKRGTFYGCSRYPECDRTYPGRPVARPCPLCGHAFLIERKKGKATVLSCPEKGCGYESEEGEEPGITA